MTFSVVLPYRMSGCGFEIHLEGSHKDGYIHEFRPRPEMQEWLEGRSLLSYRTIVDESPLEIMSSMEFVFSKEADALLFKLTWA